MSSPIGLARCVRDVEEFADTAWGRRPMLQRGAGPFDDLLDVASVERMLTDLARRPTFRVVRAGTPIPPAEYTMRTRIGGEVVDDVADVDRVLDLLAGGATLVMQGLQRYWAPLAEFCLDVEADVSHPVQANAYLSPPGGASGLAHHADEHDLFALQVAGGKQWDVDGLGQVELRPGDVVYIPARTAHAARTTDDHSLHITLGVLSTTYRDVVRRILDGIEADELDRPLPLGFVRPDCLAELVTGLEYGVHATLEALRKQDLVETAEAERDRRARHARTRHPGRLQLVVQPETLGDSSYVRRCSDARIDVIDDTSTVVLITLDKRLRMPAIAADALHVVAARDWFRVDELPGLDADDRLVLVRRLVREGVLEQA